MIEPSGVPACVRLYSWLEFCPVANGTFGQGGGTVTTTVNATRATEAGARRQRARALLDAGMSVKGIAGAMGVRERSVYRYLSVA